METVRERALSFLHTQWRWVETFADQFARAARAPERDGRAAGAVGALLAAGVLDAAETDAWRARLSGPPPRTPAPGQEVRERADAVLEELLAAVPVDDDDDDLGGEHSRFEGALAALRAIDAADGGAWDTRLRAKLGWPSWEEEMASTRALNAGGTEEELVAVLPGTEEVDGVRVLFGLRFADGISFLVHADERDGWPRLHDDVGTEYSPGGGGGGNGLQSISFRTAPPPQARWVELSGVGPQPLRVAL